MAIIVLTVRTYPTIFGSTTTYFASLHLGQNSCESNHLTLGLKPRFFFAQCESSLAWLPEKNFALITYNVRDVVSLGDMCEQPRGHNNLTSSFAALLQNDSSRFHSLVPAALFLRRSK